MKRSGFKIKQQIPLKRTAFSRKPKVIKEKKESKLPKLKKQKSISKLKKELWTVFSKWIRQRDRYTCVTCGKKGEGSGIHAGHYITKAVGGLILYFDERNVHAQCYRCNIHLSGNWTAYREFMIQTYGETIENELMNLRGVVVKWTEYDYLQKIDFYKSKISDVV
jgi:hypothetical protein